MDLGFLAEAMLFYGSVRVLGGPSHLAQLLKGFGPALLKLYLEEGHLQIAYVPSILGIQTDTASDGRQLHRPVVINAPKLALDAQLPKLVAEVEGLTRKGLSRELQSCIDVLSHEPDQLTTSARSDLADEKYVLEAVRSLVADEADRSALRFELRPADNHRFEVATNLDIRKLAAAGVVPRGATSAHILAQLYDVRDTLYWAAKFDSEVASFPRLQALLRLKLKSVVDQRRQSEDQIAEFQDFLFDDGKAVREAINSRGRSFEDLLPVVRRAKRFREWLSGKPPDQRLVREYFREVSAGTWLDATGPKAMRWVLFQAAGFVAGLFGPPGVAAGLVLAAADSFWIDKFAKGWRPNQFVDESLRGFVATNSS